MRYKLPFTLEEVSLYTPHHESPEMSLKSWCPICCLDCISHFLVCKCLVKAVKVFVTPSHQV